MSVVTNHTLSTNLNNVWGLSASLWATLSNTYDGDANTGLALTTNDAQNEQLFGLTNVDVAYPIVHVAITIRSRITLGSQIPVVIRLYPGGYSPGKTPAAEFSVISNTTNPASVQTAAATVRIPVSEFNDMAIGISAPGFVKSTNVVWFLAEFSLTATQEDVPPITPQETFLQFATDNPGDLPTLDSPIYEDREQLMAPMGSFWNGVYHGQGQLSELLLSRGLLAHDAEQFVDEVERCLSREQIPDFRVPVWKPIKLKESTKNNLSISTVRYGQNYTFGNDIIFGRSVYFTRTQFAVDDSIAEVPTLTNRITDPSVIWVDGLDYVFDRKTHTITFRYDPFSEAKIQPSNIHQDNEIVDREIVLWAHLPSEDLRYVESQYGYAAAVYGESSPEYRLTVTSIMDCLVAGTSTALLLNLLAALTGIPLAKSDETVQYVMRDSDRLKIATDKNVYLFSSDASPLVQQGDQVAELDSLVSGLRLYQLNQHPELDITGLCVGDELTGCRYSADLFFANTAVPLEAFEQDGKTRFRFEIGGWPIDVDAFWQDVYDKENSLGVTFAASMDVRTDRATPVQPNHLPKTVNPMRFLLENALEGNALVLYVESGIVSSDAPGLQILTHIRKLLSPYTALLVVVQLPHAEETGIMGEDAVVEVQDNLEPIEETNPEQQENLHALRTLSGVCQ